MEMKALSLYAPITWSFLYFPSFMVLCEFSSALVSVSVIIKIPPPHNKVVSIHWFCLRSNDSTASLHLSIFDGW